ncbi:MULTISPECIES: PhzF family phenazine biosynthesis protein [unclassified Pseudomonas]|uniref:PhzF family phenazine biosynthesis protein n=1 Tax=unclassified Pseudomonas TaxID=196821 RepID=UPI002AC89820|nr:MULTISPECIES: PhzF family phenazine biosynthesis protein [unclassified Pseudomonas]MEB0039734.1 PhzF family phenazine biosynthesis protein [Pseudomonas sp. MH10]MEB0075690.1 PhzF family phenazine biosynthesis protein [Pseudomonas sp. MH10out]MEB0093015.1 PhzF family phenazine biosynthesis protein [Pseudomonas sp. CCI4.2]MEB0099833.1 PhzF family phenazine biosynthesis protein [Pseudomonas sp. CCI3.2]MEB0131035.1 PhzF family phenazine biosynthesis protein [Pseudomonas sp. CCI2.4]
MQLEFHQVDAFSEHPFSGNPAMVYRLDSWLSDELMQNIAAEHNLAETAFLVREGLGWHIRWFTPSTEVPLCGHATLAAAHVLFEVYSDSAERIDFIGKAGALSVTREGDRLVLDFPAMVPTSAAVTIELERALGVDIVDVYGSVELMVVLESEQAVRDCEPDMAALIRLPWPGVIVTARGETHDFVSRYFAPAIGVPEDPVTGSTHCSLIPYWSSRLGKLSLSAYQCSTRGGELFCRLEGDRVKIGGHARLVASGKLLLG